MSDTQRPTVTLSISEAAARVKRSTRTIEQWIADEDLQVIEIRNMQGKVIRRYVEEGQLLTVLRTKLTAPRGGKGKPRRRPT